MDSKKLFEYEYLLESMKPKLTRDELENTMQSSEHSKANVQDVVSFTLSAVRDGLYIKPVNKKGEHGKMLFINAIAAEELVQQLSHGLNIIASIGQNESAIELDDDHSTVH